MGTLVKRNLHASVAQTIFKELGTRSSKFYFYLSRPDVDTILFDIPTDSVASEFQSRNDIIIMREIKPSDACLVVRRIDWQEGQVYDKYDDNLSTGLAGINLIDGGFGYSFIPSVTITPAEGDNGHGATAVATINDSGSIIDVTVTNSGTGYISAPSVAFTGAPLSAGGRAAVGRAKLNKAFSGATKLEDANFYVLTEDDNVYKCLNNNFNQPSLYKPYSTSEKPIKMDDGYVWKFMYKIPAYLKNKFLTPQYIPVVNALNDNFYSNGEIGNATIVSGGNGYTWAKVLIEGDGYDEENPYLVKDILLNNGGSGYEGLQIEITPPYAADSTWYPSDSLLSGEIVTHDNRFYKTIIPGVTGTQPPIHREGTNENGTALLKYIGETAKVVSQVQNEVITSVNLVGRLHSIELDSGGSGYITTPTATIVNQSGSVGSGAVLSCKTLGGVVSQIQVIDRGDNYTKIPDVIIGKKWEANLPLSAGEQIYHSDELYTVMSTGVTGNFPPLHLEGTLANGTCNLLRAGKRAKARAVMLYGYGYTSLPQVLITSTTGSDANIGLTGLKSTAVINPIVSNGSIVALVLENRGIGYTYSNMIVYGDGSGAVIKSDLKVGDINSVQGNSELQAVDGSINHIELLSGGYNYDTGIPIVVIEGDGSGATASAELNYNDGANKLLRVNVIDPGTGYRWARVRFLNTMSSSGAGAQARAIIGPYLGHGVDSVKELFASKLMLHTVFSGSTILGFEIEKNYRQLGIIKNPRRYTDKSFASGDLHTPCVIVTGVFDKTKYHEDMIIRTVTNNRKYKIVAMSSNSMFLQNLENYIPEVGEFMDNGLTGIGLNRFSVESIVLPSVDKYSGEILYIENRSEFRPSTRESIAIRTVLTF